MSSLLLLSPSSRLAWTPPRPRQSPPAASPSQSAPSAASDVNDSATTTGEIVDWSLTSSVADDADLDTPEIKTVLQEVVGRGGWESGNAVMFRYYSEETDSGDGSGSTVDCRLDCQSYEASSSNAAKLVVTYTY